MTLLEIINYYENGIKFEETKSRILVGTLAEAMNGNETGHKKVPQQGKRIYREDPDQTPDRKALHALYGDKIKRG
jgi:hypothetical protein